MFFCCSMFDRNVSDMETPPQNIHLSAKLTTFVKWFPYGTLFLTHWCLNFLLIKIIFPFQNLWKIVFFCSFILRCKLPKTKYSSYLSRHIWEVIHDYKKLLTVHFSLFHEKQTTPNFWLKIVFFYFSLFEFNVFNEKIPQTKRLRLWNVSQLISINIVHFYSPAHNNLMKIDVNNIFHSKSRPNCVIALSNSLM